MLHADDLRQARNRAKLTQKQLADLVDVTARTVGNWERGKSDPRESEPALRKVLGEHLSGAAPAPGSSLTGASDAQLLAEIARRFDRRQQHVEPAPANAQEGYALAARHGQRQRTEADALETGGEESQDPEEHR